MAKLDMHVRRRGTLGSGHKSSDHSRRTCLIDNPEVEFYVELKPINEKAVPKALEVTGFSLEKLSKSGTEPAIAFRNFAEWVWRASTGRTPVFVGFNAAFDWAFVNWYFHTFLGENPFGIAPLDIKAYFMGLSGCSWANTKSSKLPPEYRLPAHDSHNALSDARAQAATFSKLLAAVRSGGQR